jgi:hypothetical protein
MISTQGPGRAIGWFVALVATVGCVEARAQSPDATSTRPASRYASAPRDSVRRVQAAPGDLQAPAPPPPPAPPAPAPPAPVGNVLPVPVGDAGTPAVEANATDLSIPRAGSAAGGGEPTGEEAKEEAAAASPEPTLLMKALGMEDSKLKIYGWIQNSYTGNTNGVPHNAQNFGVNPNYKANQWMGNQYYLIFERPLEQNDEVNFGFRVDNLYGNDWTFNHSRGIGDTMNRAGRFSGYDPAQFYVESHLPIITKGGLDVKFGRWYTLAGYEQVPAISRPLLSVPIMFNYGQPFTHFGALTTLHVTDKLNWYNGAINGWDRNFDTRYNYGYIGGINYTFNEDKTNLAVTYVGGPNQFPSFIPTVQNIQPTGAPVTPPQFSGIRNTQYGADWRHLFTTVITHKWNDKLTQVFETDQGWEKGVPFVGGKLRRQDIGWFSLGTWLLYSFNEKLTGVYRTEVFFDGSGVRTGTTGGNFYEHTLGMIYKPKSWLWIRPEARYDYSQFVKPYNDGTRSSQLTLAFDVILLF